MMRKRKRMMTGHKQAHNIEEFTIISTDLQLVETYQFSIIILNFIYETW